MKLQESIPLSSIYRREEDFSEALAKLLRREDVLKIGTFGDDVETESPVGLHRADIVAFGEEGPLVIENQFGEANWDHWGRLESYARLKEAKVAVLIAERFKDLMIATCMLRNEESTIDWYLIQAQANSHEELSFHHVAKPAIDIQVERHHGSEYSEFWAPIREGDGLFQGKPVPIRNERWISKHINNIAMALNLNSADCYVRLTFNGEDRVQRREETLALFPESEFSYECTESPTEVHIKFPVLDKGKKGRDDWDEIRKKLVDMGTCVYNRIAEHHE